MDIDESLTYGTRRATLPTTRFMRETKKDEETDEVFWEDNEIPLCGTLHNDGPRRMSQDWDEIKRNIRRSSLTTQSRRIEKVSKAIFYASGFFSSLKKMQRFKTFNLS